MPDYIRHAQDTYARLRANEILFQRQKDELAYQERINALLRKEQDRAAAAQKKGLKRQREHPQRDRFIEDLLHQYQHDEEFKQFVDNSLAEGAAALRKGYRQLKAWLALNFPARP